MLEEVKFVKQSQYGDLIVNSDFFGSIENAFKLLSQSYSEEQKMEKELI